MRIRVTIERLDDDGDIVRKAMATIDENGDDCQLDSKSLGFAVGEAIQMIAYPRVDEVVANAISVCGLEAIANREPVSKEEIANLVEAAEDIVSKWDDYDEELNSDIDEILGVTKPSDN